MYIFLLTIPAEVYFYLATDCIAFRCNRGQRTVNARQYLAVFNDVYVVNSTITGYIQVDTATVAADNITHEGIVETEVY